MLYLTIGRENHKGDNFVLNSNLFFLTYHKPEWFEDPLIVRAIEEIDRSKVIKGEALENRFGQGYSVTDLCGGTKCLCCIKFFPEKCFNMSQMGDNVLPFVLEIARERDVICVVEHCIHLTDEILSEGIISVNGKLPKDYEEYWDIYSDALEKHDKYIKEVIKPKAKAEREARQRKKNANFIRHHF